MMSFVLGVLACYTQKYVTAVGLVGVFWLTVRHTYRVMKYGDAALPFTEVSLFALLAAVGLLL